MSLKKPLTIQGTVVGQFLGVRQTLGIAHTINNESAPESLGVVVLKDVENFASLTDARSRVRPGLARLEVDEQRQGLNLRRHKVDNALEHEDEVLDLARRGLGVLAARVQVMADAALLVVAQDDLLAGLVFGRDVIRSQLLDAVLSPPRKRAQDAFLSLLLIPFRCAQKAEETFPSQPELLSIGNGAGLALSRWDFLPVFDLLEQPVVLFLLVSRKRRLGLGLAVRGRGSQRDLEDSGHFERATW